MQSISKVFRLAEVRQERGAAAIEGWVGVDATGQVFNSIVAVEQYKGHEMSLKEVKSGNTGDDVRFQLGVVYSVFD